MFEFSYEQFVLKYSEYVREQEKQGKKAANILKFALGMTKGNN